MEGATARQEDRPLHVVVGATGPLGTWLVRQLVDRGLPVRAVSRSGGGEHGPGV
jgi:nucleoside-diphosphate-sugar epimerase